ncbi:hypothetical protein MNV49_003195 [Pseudohyphozyma bogoriensis]|nr:hypothetical protein MNV49_003195 [Pseudohyphozyma bogoriensis]
MAPTLPPELLFLILSDASLNDAELARCCCVSRTFLAVAQPLLYHTIVINNTQGHDVLDRTLRASSAIASLARRLEIEYRPAIYDPRSANPHLRGMEGVKAVLEASEKLAELSLAVLMEQHRLALAPMLHDSAARITKLEVTGWTPGPSGTILILDQLPHLCSLVFRVEVFSGQLSGSSERRLSQRLTSLEVTPASTMFDILASASEETLESLVLPLPNLYELSDLRIQRYRALKCLHVIVTRLARVTPRPARFGSRPPTTYQTALHTLRTSISSLNSLAVITIEDANEYARDASSPDDSDAAMRFFRALPGTLNTLVIFPISFSHIQHFLTDGSWCPLLRDLWISYPSISNLATQLSQTLRRRPSTTPQPAPSPFDQLPVELLQYIIELLVEDIDLFTYPGTRAYRQALLPLSLVAHRWILPSREILHRHVCFTDEDVHRGNEARWMLVNQERQSDPTVAPYRTKSLVFLNPMDLTPMNQVISACVGLETLRTVRTSGSGLQIRTVLDGYWMAEERFSGLTSLSLDMPIFIPPNAIPSFHLTHLGLNSFKRVDGSSTTFAEDAMVTYLRDTFPRLTDLSFRDCTKKGLMRRYAFFERLLELPEAQGVEKWWLRNWDHEVANEVSPESFFAVLKRREIKLVYAQDDNLMSGWE